MTSCKLLVYYQNDFQIFSGTITNESPLTVQISDFIAEDYICTKLKWYDNIVTNYAEVEITNINDDVLTLSILSDISKSEDDTHLIEFVDYFEAAKVTQENSGELKYRVDKINTRFRSSLTNQIKKMLTDETLTNQYMFKMLIQLDEKLGELLDSLKEDEPIPGIRDSKMLSLGGSGLSFVYVDDISVGDEIYIQSMPKSGSGLNFAAICTVTDVIKNRIIEANFSYIDESTTESVIHYIFQKEREQLKRSRG